MASNVTGGSRPILKVIILGDSGVGKTTLVDIFKNGKVNAYLQETDEVDIFIKDAVFHGKNYMLEIRDVPGQETYRDRCSSHYPDCHACILVFAFDDYASYENLTHWYRHILEYVHEIEPLPFPFLVIGNKTDLIGDQPIVPVDEVQAWCKRFGIRYYETNCMDVGSVVRVFDVGLADVFKERRDRLKSDAKVAKKNRARLSSGENDRRVTRCLFCNR